MDVRLLSEVSNDYSMTIYREESKISGPKLKNH